MRLSVKALLLIAAALIAYLPHRMRAASLLFSGGEPYYHLSHGTVGMIIKSLSSHSGINLELVSLALPIALGLACTLLFMEILKKLGLGYRETIITACIFILSPSFLFLFATLNAYAFAASIMLLSAYFMLCNRKLAAIALLYALPLFGTMPFIAAMMLLAIDRLKAKDIKAVLIALPSIAVLLFARQEMLRSYGSFISDFGGRYGLGLFIIILAFFGLMEVWKEKYRHLQLYLSLIALFILAALDIRMLSLASMPLCALAAIGILGEIRAEWQSVVIKTLTILILVCGIVFSAFSYATFLSRDMPNSEVIGAITKLKEMPQGIVLSEGTRVFWAEAAGKGFIADDWLLHMRSPEEAKKTINDKSIKYIWIDKDMEYTIWESEDEGMLYLLKYGTEDFHVAYSNDYVTIYEVGAL